MQVICGCGGRSLNAFSDALCVRAMCCEIKCGYRIVSTVKVLVLVIVSLNFWYGMGWVVCVLLYVEFSESGLWGMVL